MGAFRRDPLSELFDEGARHLLARAYARPDQWVVTRLLDPSPMLAARLAAEGDPWDGPDPIEGQLYRDRWTRAFARALWHQHQFWSDGTGGWRGRKRIIPAQALTIRVRAGRRFPPSKGLGTGRQVRVMVTKRTAETRRYAAEHDQGHQPQPHMR